MDVTVCGRVMIADVYKLELTSLSVTVQVWTASPDQTVIYIQLHSVINPICRSPTHSGHVTLRLYVVQCS